VTAAPAPKRAAVVTVGTEITTGLMVDTNTSEIALALEGAGVRVVEAVSVGDDRGALASALRRLAASCDLVVVTGGLGPTHDDVTRHGASEAFGLPLIRDPALVAGLAPSAARHTDPRAAEQVYSQADVLEGARVLPAVKGTAPGQVVRVGDCTVALLPGPPREMRPLLASLVREWGAGAAAPAVLRCAAVTESDVQVAAQDVLDGRDDVEFTVLASPGDVRVVLHDRGIGAAALAVLADAVAERLGPVCYSRDGSTLAETVLRLARERGETIATAESCTGGLAAAALTAVPGASAVFLGSAVTYSDESKTALLAVEPGLLARFGAVSEEVARAMAEGARAAFGATRAVAVTGIAGPDGGTSDKPVGTVWFALADADGSGAEMRLMPGDRELVRVRSAVVALDLLRRRLAGL
jgi:nicotinamide-nucleotide amidase